MLEGWKGNLLAEQCVTPLTYYIRPGSRLAEARWKKFLQCCLHSLESQSGC